MSTNLEAGSSPLSARVLTPGDLVAYQEGSVVSRQVLGDAGGNVTMFAFSEGEGLSEHTVPYDALVYVIEGKAQVTISGKPLTLDAGEMVIMPAGRPHALKATEPFKMLLVMIKS